MQALQTIIWTLFFAGAIIAIFQVIGLAYRATRWIAVQFVRLFAVLVKVVLFLVALNVLAILGVSFPVLSVLVVGLFIVGRIVR